MEQHANPSAARRRRVPRRLPNALKKWSTTTPCSYWCVCRRRGASRLLSSTSTLSFPPVASAPIPEPVAGPRGGMRASRPRSSGGDERKRRGARRGPLALRLVVAVRRDRGVPSYGGGGLLGAPTACYQGASSALRFDSEREAGGRRPPEEPRFRVATTTARRVTVYQRVRARDGS
jgi:hypothetical protein